jgi:hypothetical protein
MVQVMQPLQMALGSCSVRHSLNCFLKIDGLPR